MAHISDTHVTVEAEDRQQIAALTAAGAAARRRFPSRVALEALYGVSLARVPVGGAAGGRPAARGGGGRARSGHRHRRPDQCRYVGPAPQLPGGHRIGAAAGVLGVWRSRRQRRSVSRVEAGVYLYPATTKPSSARPTTASIGAAGTSSSMRARRRSFRKRIGQRKERWLWADLAAQPAGAGDRASAAYAAAGGDACPPEQIRTVRLVLHGHAHTSKVWSYGQTVVLGDADALFRRH